MLWPKVDFKEFGIYWYLRPVTLHWSSPGLHFMSFFKDQYKSTILAPLETSLGYSNSLYLNSFSV